jgi:hypothetical protein
MEFDGGTRQLIGAILNRKISLGLDRQEGRKMRKFLLVAGTAVCVFGTPAFAATGAFQAQGQSAGIATTVASPGAILVAQNGPPTSPPGNSGSNGNQDHTNNGKSGKPECSVVSPSHPCLGNNGFGNGGNDGSPNGMPNPTIR